MGSTSNGAVICRDNAATFPLAIIFVSTDRSVPVADSDTRPEVLTAMGRAVSDLAHSAHLERK